MAFPLLPKLDLNVTNECNFRCKHCAFDSGCSKMPQMPLEKIIDILKETKDLGGRKIDITGGEAMIRKDIFSIIKSAKSIGYKIELVSNGYLLTSDKLKHLKEIGLDSIAISLDGSNYETYSKIRKTSRGIYEKVMENIQSAIRLFPTKINTTVINSNLKDIPNITRWCVENDIHEHGLYYFTPVGRGRDISEEIVEPLIWLEFIRKKLKKFINSRLKISLEIPFIEAEKYRDEFGCLASNERSHLQILPNGNVYPCAIMASYNKPIANLNGTTIAGIWQNNRLWERYWGEMSDSFNLKFNFGACFNGYFNLKENSYQRYHFVCPIRKFSIKDIL